MKVLITWEVHQGKLADALAQFSKMTKKEEEALMGKNLKLITRWHDVVRGTGAAVYEAKSIEAVSAYALNWSPLMDLDISLVLDDEETKALGKKRKK